MRWLLHGNLSPSVSESLVRHEHTIDDSPSPPTESAELLKFAQQKQLNIMTADTGLVNASLAGGTKFGRSIVYLQDKQQDSAIDRLFERYKRLTPGRLYTVTGARVKIRQLPGK